MPLARSALLLLLATTAHADPAPFLATGFGAPAADLRLAVTVDAAGTAATFRIENVGRRRITFTTEYSCSGMSPFAISIGMSAGALDRAYGYEPRVKGLTLQLETSCTVNVPRKRVTVGPGKTVAIVVPFATEGDVLARKETTFQASATLHLEGRNDLIVVRSPVVKR